MYPTQVEMCTKGPSLPKHMPVDTAKMAPKALMVRTRRERKLGMTNPERIVLISGMPDPEAMYMVFPGAGGIDLPILGSLELCSVDALGSVLFVNIVTEELTIPNASAIPTYIAKELA
jgi:hypothetical protein